jgi:hypothetical protein
MCGQSQLLIANYLMKRYLFLPIVAILFTLTGCSDKPETPTVGQQASFDRVCDKSNDGKRIAVEGFLKLPEKISSKEKISLLLEIRPAKEMSPKKLGVWTRYGDKVNQLSFVQSSLGFGKPDKNGKLSYNSSRVNTYTHQDLKVNTNDGKTVSYLDRVRVSGKVGFPSKSSGYICVLNNPLFESIK